MAKNMTGPVKGQAKRKVEDLYDTQSVVASTELTGLIPEAPQNAAELASYHKLMSIPEGQKPK